MSTLNVFHYDFHPQTIVKRAIQGAIIGLVLMIIFMYGDNVVGNKDWAFNFREYFPMITISIGGALGAVFFALTAQLRNQGGWVKAAAIVASILVFVFALWISAVAGFAVTGDWD